jgi:hypothetical protein
VLAANKLTQKDKIFAVIGPLGTPTNLAAMPIYFEKNVPHLFPLSAGARNVRAAAQAQVLDGRDVLRADPRRAEAPGEGEGLQEGSARCTRTTTSASRSRGAASRR